jgi:translation initiation factor 2A
LLICSTDVDQSGKSYYGQQTLHYLDISGVTFLVSLKKDGPIHNIGWVPSNSALFCVIYGFMPAKASLFNNKAETVFDFGEPEMINIISFNPFGNLVALAGFGNLRGGVQVWDIKQKALVSQFKAPETTSIDWCPDGKRILTATTSPRLRVGNGFRIWTYDGIREHENIYDTNTELYEILWQPSNQFSEPVVEVPKGVTVKKPSEPVKYVPPQMRTNTKSSDSKPKPKLTSNAVVLTEFEKKSKNLRKKLEQIDKLKELMASGKQLEKNQLEKVSKEQEIIEELRELQLNS